MTLGEYLRSQRESAGLTQAMLAKKIKVGAQFVSNVERDICNPSLSKVARWCDIVKADKFYVRAQIVNLYHRRVKKALKL